jgi:hypothetical protein
MSGVTSGQNGQRKEMKVGSIIKASLVAFNKPSVQTKPRYNGEATSKHKKKAESKRNGNTSKRHPSG